MGIRRDGANVAMALGLLAGVAGCSAKDAEPAATAGSATSCGEGTTLVGSQCLPLPGSGGDGGVACGPGTRLEGSQCLASDDAGATDGGITCGAGTVLDAGVCVANPSDAGGAEGGITCGPGTYADAGFCVPSGGGADAGIACGPGTVLDGGACVPSGADPDAPVVEAFGAYALYGDAPFATTLTWTVKSPGGAALTCDLDADGDGTVDQTFSPCGPSGAYGATYTNPGAYDAKLTVRDAKGKIASATNRLFSNRLDYKAGVRDVRALPGLVSSDIAGTTVTLAFASAAQVPSFAVGDTLWDRSADGYVGKVTQVSVSGATLTAEVVEGDLQDVASGGFYGVRDVYAVVPLPDGTIPAYQGSTDGWIESPFGLPDLDLPFPGDGAHVTMKNGQVVVGVKIDQATFDPSPAALSVELHGRTKLVLAGDVAAEFKVQGDHQWDLPVPTLGQKIDLKFIEAKLGLVPKAGVSAEASLNFAWSGAIQAETSFDYYRSLGLFVPSVSSVFPLVKPTLKSFDVNVSGEAKVYFKPELVVSWGKRGSVCKPGAGLNVGVGVEAGLAAKVEKKGACDLSLTAGYYAEAQAEFQPPLKVFSCATTSFPISDHPFIQDQCLWSPPPAVDAGSDYDAGTGADGGPCTPVVTQVTPLSATVGQTRTFLVSGSCLPSTLAFHVDDCASVTPTSKGASLWAFQCTPGSVGVKSGVVKDKPNGTELKSFTVSVFDPVVSGCELPYLVCDGQCVNPATSTANCGACGYACPSGQYCAEGSCVAYGSTAQSCAGNTVTCGTDPDPQGCCASLLVPGGTFPMGRCVPPDGGTCSDSYASGSSSELPEHAATVATFRLDKYEVNVGRFRQFVAAYPNSKPHAGAGANPLVVSSGWNSAWDASLPADQAALTAGLKCGSYPTWTDAPAANEGKAINCVDWYEAFAFCAWDGGRLPTEAEWEYAAAGGAENRLYPWGNAAPSSGYANYSGNGVAGVGSYGGIGKWGQFDLAGNVWEWVFDGYDASWYSGGGNGCNNCAQLGGGSRVLRGGSWINIGDYLRAANRSNLTPSGRYDGDGFRCARGQ